MNKKVVFVVSVLAVCGFLFWSGAPKVQAITAAELQSQITTLLAQIASLQQQLAQVQGTTTVWCYDFNTNLRYGDSGTEVYNLHIALEREGFSVSDSEKKGVAYFGEYTASAVVGFQQKYSAEILTPLGLKYGTGFVGISTRAKLNELYSCETVCQNLWFYDNSHQYCQQSKFCGAYMYLGLHTFSTESECKAALGNATSSITCTDSDGGKDYYVKGQTIVGTSIWTDICINASQVQEGHCDPTSSTEKATTVFTCPNGCQDGACLPSIKITFPAGGESLKKGSDSGVNLKFSPSVPLGGFVINLIRPDVTEVVSHLKYCGLNNVIQDNVVPPNVTWQWKVGYDADGEEIPNGSYRILVHDCGDKNDTVWTGGTASVKSNIFSIVATTTTTPTCTDSDNGKDYYVKGTVIYGTQINTDFCSTSRYLYEQYCSNGRPVQIAYACPNGCQDGACLQATTTITCTDSDGGQGVNYQIYTKGIVVRCEGNECVSFSDFCGKGDVLTEYYCTKSRTVESETFQCPSGYVCRDGAYIQTTTPTCTDSDGGKDYYVKGTTYGPYVNNIDTCYQDGIGLQEQYCNSLGTQSAAYYNCPNGCQNGACLQAPIGNLNVALDSTTPESKNITPGQTSVTFSVIKLSASVSGGNIDNINTIQVSSDSTNAADYLTNIKIYNGIAQLGTTVINLPYNGSYYYASIPVGGFSIPAGSYKLLTLVADIKSTASNGDVRLGITNLDFASPGANVSGMPVYGENMTIVSAATTTSTCTDSDGGLNYYVKGTTVGPNVYGKILTKEDYCTNNGLDQVQSASNIEEYYCDSSDFCHGTFYNCPNGCENGACLQATTTTLNIIESQLADISKAVTSLTEEINKLLGR